MQKLKSFVTGLLVMLCAQSASAQLTAIDGQFGPNSVIYDARSGLSWLQLSRDQLQIDIDGLIISGAESNFTINSGAYSGYRVATSAEISSLVFGYSICANPNSLACTNFESTYWVPADTQSAGLALDLIQMFGGQVTTTSEGWQSGRLSGMYVRDGAFTTHGWGLAVRQDQAGYSVLQDRFSGAPQGLYLVAAVPEPSTYALMLTGLVAVAFVARRRRETP